MTISFDSYILIFYFLFINYAIIRTQGRASWQTTLRAIANYCAPNGIETNYIVQILDKMKNGNARVITKSLERTCNWKVRQTTGGIAFDAHTFPCAGIVNVVGFFKCYRYLLGFGIIYICIG